MPGEDRHVHAEAAIEAAEQSAHRPAGKVDRSGEGGQRHALHAGEHLEQPPHVLRPRWCEGEAAVAGEHGRDPVPARGRGGGLEMELGFVVGVDVDESRRHDQTIGVNRPTGGIGDAPDAADPAALDLDVRGVAGVARPVHDPTAPHE